MSVCAHVGHIPPTVSCVGWPAVTFLARVGDCHTIQLQLLWIPLTSNKLTAFECQEMMESYTRSQLIAHKHHYLVIWINRYQIMHWGLFLLLLTWNIISLKSAWQKKEFFPLTQKKSGKSSMWTWLLRAIKKFLSSLNRVLLHAGHRDFC